MRKAIFDAAFLTSKVVVFLGLLAACLLHRDTIPGLAVGLKYTALLLCGLAVYQIFKTGNLGWRGTAKDAVERSRIDTVAILLVVAEQLVSAFVL